ATGRLDLMALTPDGPLGARVAIALANLHREGLLQRANQRGTWTGRLLIAIVIAFVTLLVPQTRQDTPEYAPFIAALIGLAALFPDHIQSVALSFLAGLLGAEASDDRMSAQWSAFALLLAFQM